MLSTLTSKF